MLIYGILKRMSATQTIDQIGAEKWNQFIASTNNGSIHQTTMWANFQRTLKNRGEVINIGLLKNDKLVAAGLAVRMRTRLPGIDWYYCARGPVYSNKNDGYEILVALEKKVAEKGGAFLRYDPYVLSDENFDYLSKKNQIIDKQNFHPLDSLLLDISPSTDEIFANMKKRTRYNIRMSEKQGVTVESYDGKSVQPKQIDSFYQLLTGTADRDNFTSHGKNYYADFMSSLGSNARLFIASFGGEPIAASIITTFGDTAIYYFAASSDKPEHRKIMPNYLLQAEMIRHAKTKDCTNYDLFGISPENEPNHKYAGIGHFKMMFGGRRVQYQTGKDIILSQAKTKLYWAAKRIL